MEWNKVTWYSKALSLVVIIAALIGSYKFGLEYQKVIDQVPSSINNSQPVSSNTAKNSEPVDVLDQSRVGNTGTISGLYSYAADSDISKFSSDADAVKLNNDLKTVFKSVFSGAKLVEATQETNGILQPATSLTYVVGREIVSNDLIAIKKQLISMGYALDGSAKDFISATKNNGQYSVGLGMMLTTNDTGRAVIRAEVY